MPTKLQPESLNGIGLYATWEAEADERILLK
jgi:hypothetical protein